MKNKKQILIYGSFVLAGVLLWYFLRPSNSVEITDNPYMQKSRGTISGRVLDKYLQEIRGWKIKNNT